MAWLSKWRTWVIVALLIWSIILIHPFAKGGLEVSKVDYPASLVLRSGDHLVNVNGETFDSVNEFNDFKEDFDYNDSVEVEVLRETYPYSYNTLNHLYLPVDENLGFFVAKSQKTNLEFSYELVGGNKFYVDVNGNLDNAEKVLDARLPIVGVDDYSIKQIDNQLVLSTSAGQELKDVIETRGRFEAKIGNETFFDANDITSVCLSGVDCDSYLYPIVNQTAESTTVVWRYGFEVRITEEASNKFAELTEELSIAKCELDRCILDHGIDYYVDDELVGTEEIFSESKGTTYSRPSVTGESLTSDDANRDKRFMQAILQGEADLEVTDVEELDPIFTSEAWSGLLVLFIALMLVGPILILIQTKKAVSFGASLLTVVADEIIVLGLLAGLNITITTATFIAFLAIPLITALYQNISVGMIKKAGIVKKKISELNSKLTKGTIAAVLLLFVINFLLPAVTIPLLAYAVLMLLITKGFFYKYLSF
jgi:hypothetical protein